MALIRITSGLALGLAALGVFVLAAAVRDGATWAPPVGLALLVLATLTAVASGSAALTPYLSPRAAWTGARVGVASLAGAVVLVAAAAAGIGRDAGLSWLVIDAAVLLMGVAALALGYALLRHVHARASLVRGWATVGAGFLLVLALFIALD